MESILCTELVQGGAEVLLIVEGLPHAHEHDIAKPPPFGPQKFAGLDDLIQQFRHGQIPAPFQPSRGTKQTSSRTAGLGRDAYGRTSTLDPEDDAFDRGTVPGPQHDLTGAVTFRMPDLALRQGVELDPGGEFGTGPLRHFRERPLHPGKRPEPGAPETVDHPGIKPQPPS